MLGFRALLLHRVEHQVHQAQGAREARVVEPGRLHHRNAHAAVELFGQPRSSGCLNRVGSLIESPGLYTGCTALENMKRFAILCDATDDDIRFYLRMVGLETVGNKKVGAFSLGMKQRLGIAIALLGNPELLILDEPVNGLDPEGIIEIREMLRRFNEEENITILISSHILAELSQLCTDYMFIRKGTIRAFSSAEELHKICGEYYHIHTDNDSVALAVLQNKLGIENCDVLKDGSLRLFERLNELPLISKTLYENGLVPVTLHIHEADLESYYMKLVGDDNAEYSESDAAADKA